MNQQNKNLYRTEKNLIEVCYKTSYNTAKAVETALDIFVSEGFELEQIHVRHHQKNNQKTDGVYEYELEEDSPYYEIYQLMVFPEEN